MDIQESRTARFEARYRDTYADLAYKMIDAAADIKRVTGEYETVMPSKDGTRVIELPESENLLKHECVIQVFEESFLTEEPAGRQARLSEMLASGEIDNKEYRRLRDFPDLNQADSLANALEERILHDLDAIVEDGQKGYNPPDPFVLDPSDLATTLCVNYINKYAVTDLGEEKMQLLRDYFTQIETLKQKAMPQPAQPMTAAQPNVPVVPPAASMAPTSGVQV